MGKREGWREERGGRRDEGGREGSEVCVNSEGRKAKLVREGIRVLSV